MTNFSIDIKVESATRRPTVDGYYEDTEVIDILVEVFKQIMDEGRCLDPEELSRHILSARGELYAQKIEDFIRSESRVTDFYSEDERVIQQDLIERGQGCLHTIGRDGPDNICIEKYLFPSVLLPLMEDLVLEMEAFQNERDPDELESPLLRMVNGFNAIIRKGEEDAE